MMKMMLIPVIMKRKEGRMERSEVASIQTHPLLRIPTDVDRPTSTSAHDMTCNVWREEAREAPSSSSAPFLPSFHPSFL